MANTIFNLGAVKLLKKILRFQESDIQIITGNSADPTTTAIDAVAGSLYIRSGTGELYIKQDNGLSTNFLLTVTDAELANYIPTTEKGTALGVATLDAGGKIPVAQLPSAVMTYEGIYNATTNTPTLVDGTGDAGMVYLVSVAGTQDFGAGAITFAVGDWVVYNGTIWQKSTNSNSVMSVNGYTGVVVLDSDDISEGLNLYFTDTRARTAAVVDSTAGSQTDQAPSVQSIKAYIAAQIAAIDTSAFVLKAGDTMTGNLNMSSNSVTGLSAPGGADHAANKAYVDQTELDAIAASNAYTDGEIATLEATLPTTYIAITQKGAASGVAILNASSQIDAQSLKIVNVATPTVSTDAANKAYVDTSLASVGTVTNVSSANADIGVATGTTTPILTLNSGSGANQIVKRNASSEIDAATQKIINVLNPTNAQDAATKNYVDTAVASGANTSLSNLVSTSINQNLVPNANATFDLGSSSNRWRIGYLSSTIAVGTGANFMQIVSTINPSTINTDLPGTAVPMLASSGQEVIIAPRVGSSTYYKVQIATEKERTSGDVTANIELTTGQTTLNSNRGEVSIKAKQLNMNSKGIVGVLDPVNAQDAATKNYVDTAVASGANTSLSNLTSPTSINQDLLPSSDNTRDVGSVTARFKDVHATSIKNGTAASVDLAAGTINNSAGQTTVDFENRQLQQGSFVAATWDSIGLDMYDSANANNSRIAGLGNIQLATGTNMNALLTSNRTTGLAAAGVSTVSITSSRFYIIKYRAARTSGGNDCKVGTIHIAKEVINNNTNAAINDTYVATNVSMDDLTFAINSSGNLEITNGTAYAVDLRYEIHQL